jgi:hypothetical protein
MFRFVAMAVFYLVVFYLVLSPALALAQAASAPAPAASAPTAPAPDRARIDGFRSAQWGMTEAQVKQAIQKDFNLSGDKIRTEENLAEHTLVLSAAVPDLLEGAGLARVSYIFGFSTKKLIQVNVLWGTPSDPQSSPEKVVAAANQLRQLFLDSNYDPETVTSNVRMSDGSILVFQGNDSDKHTTILRLASGASAPKGKPDKITEAALSLSYVMDPRNPDIYRLKKGAF